MRRKVPIRTCIACRTERPKKELARLVRTTEGEILWDPSGKVSGRGAYLCHSLQCLETAQKRRSLERALGGPASVEQMDRLRKTMAPVVPAEEEAGHLPDSGLS
ncbi:MAG TPA: YlxR family protein [Armatimonadota bacterium]